MANNWYPVDYTFDANLRDAGSARRDGLTVGMVAHYQIAPEASGSGAIWTGAPTLVSGSATGSRLISTGITNPDVPRALAVVCSGSQVSGSATIIGLDASGSTITEIIATSGSTAVTGGSAFASITSISTPTGGSGTSVYIGTANTFGFPHYLTSGSNMVLGHFFDKADDAGTVSADADELAKNTYAVAGTPDGTKKLDLWYLVEG